MPITSVTSDPQALTLTLVGDYPVPVARLWSAYADPRQLERFWGPPSWPATFTRHDLSVSGRSEYHMTGPDGARAHGWWRFLAVEPERRIEVEDGFADAEGRPDDSLPTTRMVFTFQATPSGSRLVSVAQFPSVEAMQKLVEMGIEEGARLAMGQLDELLADLAAFTADLPTAAQVLDDRRVRISRVLRGSVQQAWRAHHDPALMKRWLLGPEGWTMAVCEVAEHVGDSYRYEWEKADGSQRFGFEGELLESEPPTRAVTTERMLGTEGPVAVNELTLAPFGAGTLLTLVITYPSAEVRDAVLGTGMTDGMEASYARLERELDAPAAA